MCSSDLFGRRPMEMAAADLEASVAGQCAALQAAAAAEGARVPWMKPHGALYHRADTDPLVARAVVNGAVSALGDVGIVGPAGGALEAEARSRGLPFLREGFADRGMGPDGRLIPRGQPGAVIGDPVIAAAQARRLVGSVDVLCVHGDQPGAVAVALAVRAELERA